jgi:NAD(P)H-nitrite reductase large subunit
VVVNDSLRTGDPSIAIGDCAQHAGVVTARHAAWAQARIAAGVVTDATAVGQYSSAVIAPTAGIDLAAMGDSLNDGGR